MPEMNKDPFFVQPTQALQEISIDLHSKVDEKILLECIACEKEFDPRSEKCKHIPTSNYCSDCFAFEEESS